MEILGRSKLVNSIAFGMEDVNFDVEPLINFNENEDYKKFLRHELDLGASFPKAHSIALEKIFPGISKFISNPNNMLALSYMAEIKRNNFNLKVLKLKREGDIKSKFIRDRIKAGDFSHGEIILKAQSEGRISDENKLWPLLQNIFIRTEPEELRNIYGIDEGIENLFLKHWRYSCDFNDFIGRCVCSRYTRSHIRRRLIYILLNLKRNEINKTLNYIRILAFNENGRKILRNNKSEIPLITQSKFFSQIEFKASQLYELTLNQPDMSRELNTVLKF